MGIYISLWTNYNRALTQYLKATNKFTFHYELIITIYSVLHVDGARIYISLWTNYNVKYCFTVVLKKIIYISLWTNYNT